MKIVVVLCSLATFAIAVPVYQENFIESSITNQPLRKRETKSALPDITSGLPPENVIENSPIDTSNKLGQGTSVEAKGFRRPIIIKRKFAYHVYRDSDEEMAHAEPGEKCREQVKFKLCDHEPVLGSKNGIKTTTFKCVDEHKTDNEMKNSIKMTKEAVEHLQRDLKRMEIFSPKMGNPHLEDIESNTALYHDIEIAREAIEHIEQNFKSVNLEVNKLNELQIPKSQGEERLNRWKEAIENIHKNFEIVKNIEDAFKSDNDYSLILSNGRKAAQSEAVQHKLNNDNLENKDEIYNDDVTSKSALSKVARPQLTSKSDNAANIGKDAENDMFIASTDNRKENIQLHSDSLKSEMNYKDASLRSDYNDKDAEKYDTIVPKESSEYSPKYSNSLSEVPKYSAREKTMNDHYSDDHELFPKVSSSALDSVHDDAKIEENKASDKFQLIMKTALQERENRNPIIKMKSVKEILGNRKDQVKAVTSKEDNINEYEEMFFNSNNKNSLVESVSSVAKSAVAEDSDNLKYRGEEKEYSDENNKGFESKDEQPRAFNTDMRLSNDQLEESKQFSADNFVNKDQGEKESLQVFSFNEKNAFSGEENFQNARKAQQTIKENQDSHYPLKDLESEDEAQKIKNVFEYNDEYKSMKSSEVQGGQERVPMIQNQELKKSSVLNDDLIVVQKEPELYKTVSEAYNENTDREQFSKQHINEKQVAQRKDASEDPKLPSSKSVTELQSDIIESLIEHHLHRDEASMRSSENQKEKKQSNENQELIETLPMTLDIGRQPEEHSWPSFKSDSELPYSPIVSISTNSDGTTDDQYSPKLLESMRSAEKQIEKMQSRENDEAHEPLLTSLYTENVSGGDTWPISKSVPELKSDLVASLPKEKVEIIDNLHSTKDDASMRLSQIQNEKLKLKENQEFFELSQPNLISENHEVERNSQYLKSIPELESDLTESLPMDKLIINNNQQFHKEEASMRSSWNQNENEEVQADLPIRLDIDRHPEERSRQFPKSVDEPLYDPMVSMPSNTADITDDQYSYKKEVSMRSSENQNENIPPNKNQELLENLPSRFNTENVAEDRTWQFSKSVSEPTSDLMTSLPTNKVDDTDIQKSLKGEASMRLSQAQNKKLKINEHLEETEHASTKLDIENNSEDRTSEFFKSATDMQSEATELLPTDKVEISNSQYSYREEASMRSSESQNEKIPSNEYQAEREQWPMRLDIERHPERQLSKSVPELPYDPVVSMITDKFDITDKQQFPEGVANLRLSQTLNEKLKLNKYQEELEHAATKLDIENNSEDKTSQVFKSIPEHQSDLTESLPIDEVEITNDQHLYRDEANMRSSENQNEKIYEALPLLPKSVSIENHPEEYSKSVLELQSDPIKSLPIEKVDFKNDQFTHREASMRTIENKNEEKSSNENQEVLENLPMKFNNEHQPEERTWQIPKSVPEINTDLVVLTPTDKVDIPDDQYSRTEEASMRLSLGQNEKLQVRESQEDTEHASKNLYFENTSKDKTSQLFKSISELQSDLTESLPKDKVEVTNDQHEHLYGNKASIRSSENQNEKITSIENQEIYDSFPKSVNIENHPEEYSKSVLELQSDLIKSLPLENVDIKNDQFTHREASMRTLENKNEEKPSNENQEVQKNLPMKFNIEREPEERSWQFPKSVPEINTDLVVLIPTDKVDIPDDQYSRTEEASMRLSLGQNEKLHVRESQEETEHASKNLDIENTSEDKTSQFFKSISELQSDLTERLPKDKVEVTNYQHLYGNEASIRSSENQNEKIKSNENLEIYETFPKSANIENHPKEYSKSVLELQSDPLKSLPIEKVDIKNDQFNHREASIRTLENQNEEKPTNENQEVQENLPMKFNIEREPEERSWQFPKSAPELNTDLVVLMPKDYGDITDDQYSRTEESSMRLSQGQNEKLQLREYQEESDYASKRLDNENKPEDESSQIFKSVSDLLSYLPGLPSDKVDITNDQLTHLKEASMRLSWNQNERTQSNENPEMKEDPIRFDIDPSLQLPKSVDEPSYDPKVSMSLNTADITDDQNSYENKESMRSSENENKNIQPNKNQEIHETLPRTYDPEINPKDSSWQFTKSVPKMSSDPKILMPMDKFDVTDDEHTVKGNTVMKSAQTQNEKLQFYENQEGSEFLPAGLDSQSHQEEHISQFLKSAPVLRSDLPTDQEEITNDQHFQTEEVSKIRLSENENEKIKSNDYQDVQEHLQMKLGTERHPEDRSWQFPKSVDELVYDTMGSMITKTTDISDEQSHKQEARFSENQNEKYQPNKNQEMLETLPTRFDITNNQEEHTSQFLKSVSELTTDPITSLPMDKVEVTVEQHNLQGEENMRLSQAQDEKLQLKEYQEEPEHAAMRLDIENNSEDRISQLLKSAPELQSDITKLLITDTVDMSNDKDSQTDEARMRSSVHQYETIRQNENQEMRDTLPTRFDIENHPEDREWQISKSVSDSTSDPMVSLPSENIEIIKEQYAPNEGNMRFSQNQNERLRFNENIGLHSQATKVGIENQPEYSRTAQFFKAAPEFYMTSSDTNHINNENTLFKEARLSQNQNEGQQINSNHHLFDPVWERSNIEKNLRDDSSQVFKTVYSENVLPLINQNENNEIQYPRTSLGLSNEYMNREDNAEQTINDVMHLRVSQPQQLHDNSDHMLRSSNERQYLSHNFKTLPEYKMLSPTTQFEYSNGQNDFNENLNMRINQQQSRDPEPMRWNTETQRRDPSPKIIQSNLDFDHTLYRNNAFDDDHNRPQLFSDRVLDNTQPSRWLQPKQHNDHFLNYYKNIPEAHEDYLNPYYSKNLHRVPVYHGSNNGDTFSSLDFPSSSTRFHDHMQKYHQEKSSNIDSSMEPNMHMNMREPFAKSATEVNNMHFNHPHGTARFGAALPIAGVGTGAVGVFPTANAGCGIPLLLSCSPSVISGSLARSPIAGPIFKSVDENYKYYIKRNAKNIEDIPIFNLQKATVPHNDEKVVKSGI